MNKILSVLLTIVILMSILYATSVNTLASEPSDWALEEVNDAIQNGLITDKIKLNYQKNITREEFCELVVKLYKELTNQSIEAMNNPFSDITNTEILKAYALGIVKGVSETKFAPNNTITRQEMCVMLSRTIKAVFDGEFILEHKEYKFSDSNDIADWAYDSICYSYENGIMKGIGNNKIDPKGTATSEQAVIMVSRLHKNIEGINTKGLGDGSAYSGVYVTIDDESQIPWGIRNDNTTEKLYNYSIYRDPVITDDGKHIILIHSYKKDGSYDQIEALYSKKPNQNEVKLIDNPVAYRVGNDTMVVSNYSGTWYIDNLDKPNPKRLGDKTGSYVDKVRIVYNEAEKCTAFATESGDLIYCDLNKMDIKCIEKNIKHIWGSIEKNSVYYENESGMYHWNGSEKTFISPSGKHKAYGSLRIMCIEKEEGREFYYISKNGKWIKIPTEQEFHDFSISENNNYLATVSNYKETGNLTIYKLDEDSIVDSKVYEGSHTDVKVFNDGVAFATKGYYSSKCLVYSNGESQDVEDCFIYVKSAKRVDDKIFYSVPGEVGVKIYNLNGEKGELSKEQVKYMAVINNECFYIDEVSNKKGKLKSENGDIVSKNVLVLIGKTDNTSEFVWPVGGNGGYDQKNWPKYNTKNVYHSGTDISADKGTPVYAVYSGTVDNVKSLKDSYGNYIIIRCNVGGKTVYMYYAHLNSLDVKKGQTVESGQQIGTVGNTGNSNGPHLHFEVRNSSKHYGNMNNPTLNPYDFLPKR